MSGCESVKGRQGECEGIVERRIEIGKDRKKESGKEREREEKEKKKME